MSARATVVTGLVTLGLLSAPASAGVLSKVVHGMGKASGQRGGDSKEPQTRSQDRPREEDRRETADGHYRPYHSGPVLIGAGGGYQYPTASDDTDTRIYVGAHSVRDSNGAGTVEARVSYDGFGVEISDIRYYEEIIRDDRMQNLTMDVWNIGLAYRIAVMGASERTALWVRGGFAGSSADDMVFVGASAGAELAHNMSESMGVSASARYYALQDDIRAIELKAAVALSVFRAGYRLLDFNVGPPLQGPELGIELSF